MPQNMTTVLFFIFVFAIAGLIARAVENGRKENRKKLIDELKQELEKNKDVNSKE